MIRLPLFLQVIVLSFACPLLVVRLSAADDGLLTFEKDVRPILKTHCFQCHGDEAKPKAELDLRLRRLMLAGGESGSVIVAGEPDESLLLERLELGEMPPGDKKLAADQIEIIRRWIAQGANTARDEPEDLSQAQFTLEEREFWSFQPVERARVPGFQGDAGSIAQISNPIDAFLLKELQTKQLGFSPIADKAVLIRRATSDLLGLPPTPAEVESFLADSAEDAYEKLIDRLLASPQYGERWARHWLDVAGYADSEGYTDEDVERNWAWKYRDYVIRSMNDNKPLDQFITEQLAGDELLQPPYTNLTAGQQDCLAATGFLRMAPDGTGSGGIDQNLARNAVISDTIKIVSSSLLGMTVGCAECHSHRYDPIPQADYYRFRAIFEPGLNFQQWIAPNGRLISLYTDEDRAKAAEIEAQAQEIEKKRLAKQETFINETYEKELAKLPEDIRPAVQAAHETAEKDRTEEQTKLLAAHPSVNVSAGSLYLYDPKAAEELKKMAEQAAEVRATKPKEEFIRALTEVAGQVPETRLFVRGDYRQLGETLEPGELTILTNSTAVNIEAKNPSLATTGRRLALARSLTSGRHPLVARVLANRIWMHHFGVGIVRTPADFGYLGERPTHPQLLDWLASELIASGWDLKHLHRLIMTSTAYRQSSARNEQGETIDPDNRLLWRMNVRRLDAESLRDAILAVSGQANAKMFGPPIPVMEDEVGQIVIGQENKDGENKPGAEIPLHGEEYRRSIYVKVRRTRPLAVLASFDAARPEPNCEVRASSTVAPQSLLLMNSQFMETYSRMFAARVNKEAGRDLSDQVKLAWRLAYGRQATDDQVAKAVLFIQNQTELMAENLTATKAANPETKDQPAELDAGGLALASFCQALLSSNRFLYVD